MNRQANVKKLNASGFANKGAGVEQEKFIGMVLCVVFGIDGMYAGNAGRRKVANVFRAEYFIRGRII